MSKVYNSPVMKYYKFLAIIITLVLQSINVIAQCPQSIVFTSSQSDAATHINANNYSLGNAQMNMTNTSVVAFTNAINTSHQSALSVQISHSGVANSFANRIETQYAFSEPVANLSFNLNDIDAGDRIRVLGYDQSNNLINFTTGNFTLYPSTIITYTDLPNKEFSSPTSGVPSSDTELTGRISINFNGFFVSRVVIQYYDSSSNGSYTTSLISGAVLCANPDFYFVNSGTTATTASVLANDFHLAAAATTSNVTPSAVGTWPAGFTMNANGTVGVANTVSNGIYTLNYRICSTTTPSNCDVSTITITVSTISDSDGDGIPNYLDWDDDNDGILDIIEDCQPYLAQNENGTWIGQTTSNITVTTNAALQTLTTEFDDFQSRFYVNQQGAFRRMTRTGNVTYTVTFSTPVPASEIAFFMDDLDPTAASLAAPTFTFQVNGGSPNGIFFLSPINSAFPLMNFDATTGVLTKNTNANDQRALLKGFGTTLVSSITITGTGLGSDAVSYSLFGKKICDTDSDGIQNTIDLDTDGDGCFDAIEGDENVINAQLNANGSINSGVNINGVPTIVNSGGVSDLGGDVGQGMGYSQSSSISQCTDTDGDGISDLCDLDDDNDGILDIVERGCKLTGQTIRIGYVPNARDTDGDLGYTFDGGYMSGSSALKLTNPANFGPSGTVNATIVLVPITANPITKTAINALNLNAIFLGGIDNNTTSYLSNSEYDAIKDWSDDSFSNFVIATQFNASAWGSSIVSGNVNPNTPTAYGNSTTLFNGPFGNVTSFNQGGTVQNYFNNLNPACSTKPLAIDGSSRVVMYLDESYNDILVSDVDIFTTIGGISSGNAISTNNDRLLANVFAYVATQSSCGTPDNDNDGIPNHLDLDADGDGCLDAIEGDENITLGQLKADGSINSTVDANGIPILVNAGGTADIGGDLGQGLGQSQDASKNDCLDNDNDGIPDWKDIDDDNDGVLDADESPACFYNIVEVNRPIKITSSFNGATGDPATGNDIILLRNDNFDDGGTATAFNFAASQVATPGTPIFTIEYPSSISLKSLTVTQSSSGGAITTGGGFGQLFGSNDGVNYTAISASLATNTASATRTFVTTSSLPFKYYQIRYIGTVSGGNATNSNIGTNQIYEISSLLSTTVAYIPSAHPKPGDCLTDTDGDGTPNHLDSDSDGDGCSDAFESGATTSSSVSVIPGPYGANGLANSKETAVDNGVINYVSKYYKYALTANQVLCLDSDADGVPNPIDIDDDNDGVLDTDEGEFCEKLDRTIKIGYLDTSVGTGGLTNNLLLNLENFGIFGTYNKLRGVTLVPFANAAAITEANLLANNIDIFYAGSDAADANNNPASTSKIPTSVNNVLIAWAQAHNKGVVAVQNNAVDYGYRTTSNNVNPMVSYQEKGKHVFTNGYWPIAGGLDQVGSVAMTLTSTTRTFETLLVDANLRPTLIADLGYNLIIVPDEGILSAAGTSPLTNTIERRAAANIWAHSFDRLLANQCTILDTDNDGTPNYLDLDSDGDGCSDAIEAGATSDATTNFQFPDVDTNNDGLVDAVDPDGNGVPNYSSYYKLRALNASNNLCADADGDGIFDIVDLDDDNDGILDTDEGLACDDLNRNLRIGYVNTPVGSNGLMINMLSNPVNFGSTGTYNKFPGITFVPYADEAAVTEAQLLTDNIDIFYVGSDPNLAQVAGTNKLSTALNTRVFNWSVNNDKGVVVLQNNAWDYGYTLTNGAPNTNPTEPYGPTGESAFTNGYWPETVYDMTGSVTVFINSVTRNFETTMIDAYGRSVFVNDNNAKIVFFPDATSYIDNQAAANITNATLRIAANTWAYAFDTYINGQCQTRDTDGDGVPDHLDLDTDGDGCPDALEGAGNFNPTSTASGTISSQTPNINFGTAVNSTTGIPTVVGAGQGIGDSQNAAVAECCYHPPVGGTPDSYTKTGISNLVGFGSAWPTNVPNGFIAIESKNKGFVITRVTNTSAIATPVEGMLIYDISANCVKLYNGTAWKCIAKFCIY